MATTNTILVMQPVLLLLTFCCQKLNPSNYFFLFNVAVLSSKNPICLALLVEKEEE